jgi:hypothetical protein
VPADSDDRGILPGMIELLEPLMATLANALKTTPAPASKTCSSASSNRGVEASSSISPGIGPRLTPNRCSVARPLGPVMAQGRLKHTDQLLAVDFFVPDTVWLTPLYLLLFN